MLQSFAESHIGQRKVNEDKFLIDKDLGLYIVADGVGGMSKGEIASNLACETTANCIKSGKSLKQAVQIAHQQIVDQIQSDSEKKGMASTIVAVLFKGNSYEIAWVGDSRVYTWDDELKLITRDDSYVEILFENGHIGVEDLETHPDRNVISQALGIVRKDISINYNIGTLESNQVLLLCTDGLYSIADEKNIIDSLKDNQKNNQDMQNLTQSLVTTAVEKDGKDNITLLSIVSDDNSSSANDVIKPKVFREFDLITGKAKSYDEEKAAQSKNQDAILYMNPELVDQTKLEDISPEDKNRLETVAHQFVNKEESSNRFIPIVLASILGLIGAVLLIYNVY
ncbi:MAG: protein phosphatase 2C domain-containing protein [Proteobacteria bacterium]|nr:protein phosphatase 2C domain-containing protein [Pseudomonadota bacterium]